MKEATMTRGTKAKRALSGAVLAGLAATIVATSAGPAMAAKSDWVDGKVSWTGPSSSYVTDDQGGEYNSTMYGAYIPEGGVLDGKKVWCADSGLFEPAPNAFDKDSSTKVKAPKLAHVFNEFLPDQGNEVDNMARDMAMASYLKQSKEIRHRAIVPVFSPEAVTNGIGWNEESVQIKKIGLSKFKSDVLPKAQKYYEDMLKAADGVKSAPSKLGISISTADEKVTVTLTDNDGNAVAGHKAKVKLDGATFADGKDTATITTGDKAHAADIEIKKAGTVKAEVTVDNIASDSVIRWTPHGYTDKPADSPSPTINPNMGSEDGYNKYSVQEVYEPDKPTSLRASTEESVENTPGVVTHISSQNLKPGDFVYDNFKVWGLVGDDTIDVIHELWWSPTKPDQTPEPQEGHVKLTEFTSEGVGNGDHRTDETAQLVQIPEDIEGGYLYFRESSPPSDTSEGWEGDYGIPEETGFVPYTPMGETQISQQEADKLPLQIHDDGRITGGMPGMEMPVTLQAYKDADCTVEQSVDVPDDAELLSSTVIDLKFDENGVATYQTDKLELVEGLAAEGECAAVTIVEIIPETDYSEGNVSDYGIPSETIIIDRPAPPEPQEPNTPPPSNPVVKTGATATEVSKFDTVLHSVKSAISGLLK